MISRIFSKKRCFHKSKQKLHSNKLLTHFETISAHTKVRICYSRPLNGFLFLETDRPPKHISRRFPYYELLATPLTLFLHWRINAYHFAFIWVLYSTLGLVHPPLIFFGGRHENRFHSATDYNKTKWYSNICLKRHLLQHLSVLCNYYSPPHWVQRRTPLLSSELQYLRLDHVIATPQVSLPFLPGP